MSKTDPMWVFENYGEAAELIDEHEATLAQQAARIVELREERDIVQKQLDRFYSQSHGIAALSEIEKLRYRIAELEQQRGGVALPEQDGSDAQIAFWAGFEFAVSGLHGGNIRTAWNDFKGSEQFKRLNPPGERVAVPRGLLKTSLAHLEWFGKTAEPEVTALRALLAQQGKAVGDE